jgi:hypothetical protein
LRAVSVSHADCKPANNTDADTDCYGDCLIYA